jgi:hypothetical protein
MKDWKAKHIPPIANWLDYGYYSINRGEGKAFTEVPASSHRNPVFLAQDKEHTTFSVALANRVLPVSAEKPGFSLICQPIRV